MGAFGYVIGIIFFVLALLTIMYETVGRAIKASFQRQQRVGAGVREEQRTNPNPGPAHRPQGVRHRGNPVLRGTSQEDPLSPSRYVPAPPDSTALRHEQDREYEEALRADQERERRAEAERKAAEAAARAEEERQREEEKKRAAQEQRRKEKALLFSAPEPAVGADVSQIAFRLPDGTRLQRRFNKNAQIKTLFDFIEVHSTLPPETISISMNFPKKTFSDANDSRSLAECELHPHASLFVHSSQP